MNQVIAHRGPDAEGVFEDNNLLLGHRRLSIIDVSESANQPMYSADNKLVIVFNGEIYNYREIRSELSQYPFKTQGDTEVVLAGFQEYGTGIFEKLNGIFAFAIWDREKEELIICRDRLGIKPLYYSITSNQFIFSSSVKAILASGYSSKKIRSESVTEYLQYQTVHAPNTLIEDVRNLNAGTYLSVSRNLTISQHSYWQPGDTVAAEINSYDQAKKSVREQLFNSVKLQLVSDVPFGAFLSGGIDSSLMVAIMSELHNNRIDTFSVVFKEDTFSEKKFARMVADKYNTIHHEIELNANDFLQLIPEALRFTDHPSGDGPNTYVVSKKTREAGVKMAISGLGGDELFGGYPVFSQIPELLNRKVIGATPRSIRTALGKIYHLLKGDVSSGKIAEILSQEKLDFESVYPFYRQVFSAKQIAKITKQNSSKQAVRDFLSDDQWLGSAWKNLPLSGKISVAELETYTQHVLLRDTDQMSMANGLEVRVPFLDHNLVDLAIHLKDEFKPVNPPKQILIDAFSDLLPTEVYNRPKMGFVLPYEVWMKNELRQFCSESIDILKNSLQLDSNEIDKMWKLFLEGNKSITWSRIWMLVVLGNWIKEINAES